MGLSGISSLLQVSNQFLTTAAETKPTDVKVSPGEFPSAQELLKKVVMQVLGTTDPAKADDFIKQSGFEFGKDLPKRMQEDGQNFYRFEPSEKFQKSVESFLQTGKALPL